MLMVTEPERLELHQAMRGFIGAGPANTFMELATPRDWDQVVRVHQLDAAVDGLRAELRSEIGDVRLEIADLRTEMSRLFATEIRRQTQWIIGVLTSLSIALIVATVF